MQHEELGEEKQEGWKKVRGWEEQGRSTEQHGQHLHKGGASYMQEMGFSGYHICFSGFRRWENCLCLPQDSNIIQESSFFSPEVLR